MSRISFNEDFPRANNAKWEYNLEILYRIEREIKKKSKGDYAPLVTIDSTSMVFDGHDSVMLIKCQDKRDTKICKDIIEVEGKFERQHGWHKEDTKGFFAYRFPHPDSSVDILVIPSGMSEGMTRYNTKLLNFIFTSDIAVCFAKLMYTHSATEGRWEHDVKDMIIKFFGNEASLQMMKSPMNEIRYFEPKESIEYLARNEMFVVAQGVAFQFIGQDEVA
ncbi:MAG: hypothetical protein KAS32_28060 [Candidatus Peribacteraceae bacterium]|nr:hypothetical protein [Candidatus Peribacteraceae bacterium]